MLHRASAKGTLDVLALHTVNPERYPFFLESAATHALSGRYDIVFAYPRWQALETVAAGEDFFSRLSATVAALPALDCDDLPFCGGWFVFLPYEAVQWIEPNLELPQTGSYAPPACAVRCSAAVIVDKSTGDLHFVSDTSATELAQLQHDVQLAHSLPQQALRDGSLLASCQEAPTQQYLDGTTQVLDYLLAGDTFQVNLSRAWRGVLREDVEYPELYHSLRSRNPAPFAGLACFDGGVVLSSSPERLIQFCPDADGCTVQTRPIAGTRARATANAEDQALRAQLLESLKERAEHIMLIDLERNDLGRICQAGSVVVTELMTIESYAHVHHIVSNVSGRLRPDVGIGAAIAAVFPGGTITGCPKVRAMEIIGELEQETRGAYTGSMGYISRNGHADMNILIRTLVLAEREVVFRTGAGVVADSLAEAELAETRTKARGLLRALGESV